MTATSSNAPQTDIARLWRRLNPDHYFEKGEVAILRAYFAMRPRWFDPPLESLYTEAPASVVYRGEDDEDKFLIKGPIRLHRLKEESDITELQNAVARICLTEIQDRLPQWSCGKEDGIVMARPPIERGDRLLTPLKPQHLMCINWADSGPGFSWPEEYHVTYLPGFDRYVVTASVDSPDVHGVTDWAIGWFSGKADVLRSSKRLVARWWRNQRDNGQGRWAYLFDAGLISVEEAEQMGDRVWRGAEEPW
ncbi:MAG: hypothetical protein IPM30_14855 [Burkholderiales bacterium]|nr:hypothetical protein [Burkholderiales bacterium]